MRDARLCVVEAARLQEDAASAHLPHLVNDASQLRHLERVVADVLLRV